MGSVSYDSSVFLGTPRFDVRRKLGAGGMGVVYEAFDREKQVAVALKTLRSPAPNAILRFKREFRAVHELNHRNLVQLGELVEENGTWFFTMELVDGVSLLRYVRGSAWSEPSHADDTAPTASERGPAGVARRRHISAAFDEVRLRDAMAQLCRGLHALHGSGMVHRDIKPSNVLVESGGRVVLLDFGLVLETDGGEGLGITDGQVVGTAAYMAPEQASGAALGPEADWYSVGAVLYEALVGMPPFSGSSLRILMAKQEIAPVAPRQLLPQIPADLDAVCMDLLEINPSRRPSGQAVLNRLGSRRPVGPARPARLGSIPPLAPVFVGREAELAVLGDALTRAVAGQQTTVHVRGEAGIGKSTLVRRFCEQASHSRGAVVLSGRCHERETLPYKLLDGVIDALAHVLSRLPRPEAAACLPRHASLLLSVFPVLRRVDVIAEAPRFEVADPLELRARVFAALRELFARLAERRTLIVAIDDVQWADTDGLALLAEVLRPPDVPPFLLVVSSRDACSVCAGARVIELGRLGEHAARQLARNLLARERPGHEPGDTDASIAADALGHPLFIDELVRAHTAGGPRRVGLDQVLWERIARLDRPARAVLEVVAVAGTPIEQNTAAQAAGLAMGDFARQAGLLRLDHLVRTAGTRGGDAIEPYHDVVRETVVAHLAADRLRELHQALARALERQENAPVESLARHHLAGGDRAQAAASLEAAAGKAMAKLAFDRAAALYASAILVSTATRVDLLRAQAQALALAGRARDAADAYLAAATHAEGPERLELHRLAADNLLRSGHIAEGLVLLRETMRALGVRVAGTRRGAMTGLVWRRLRLSLRGLGTRPRAEHEIPAGELGRLDSLYAAASSLGMLDYIRGADLQTRHLLRALELGEERRLIRALAIDVIFRATAGGRQQGEAEELARQVEIRARRSGDPFLLGVALMAQGAATFFASRYRAARDCLLEAERLFRCECSGVAWERITADYFLSVCRFNLGELKHNAEQVASCMEQAEHRSDVYERGLFSAEPNVWRWLVHDRPEEARAAGLRALEQWPDDDFFLIQVYLRLGQVIVLLYTGQTREAVELLDQVYRRMCRTYVTSMPYMEVIYLRYRGLAALRLGDERRVRACARRLEQLDCQCSRGVAQLYRAVLAARHGRRDVATRLALAAIPLIEASEYGAITAGARWQFGRYLGSQEGQHLLGEARAWFEREGVVDIERMGCLLAPSFLPDGATPLLPARPG
jgi:hypothetical protein